jgi:hypothetical protein
MNGCVHSFQRANLRHWVQRLRIPCDLAGTQRSTPDKLERASLLVPQSVRQGSSQKPGSAAQKNRRGIGIGWRQVGRFRAHASSIYARIGPPCHASVENIAGFRAYLVASECILTRATNSRFPGLEVTHA